MAYVRRRTTKAGSVSTALVETYRDARGRPRQRLLANLHGEPDILRALAKAIWWLNDLAEKLAAGEQADFAKIDGKLEALEREINVLGARCTASGDETQAAIEQHKRALKDAATAALGSLMYVEKAKGDHKAVAAALRRLLR